MKRRERSILGLSLAVYVPLGGLGVAWALWRGDLLSGPAPWLPLDSATLRHGASASMGLALALLTVLATRRWTRTTRWARELHASFREILGGLSRPTVLALALASGLGEEAFFRMGMQPTAGWALTSFVFGAVHVAPGRKLWVWTVWAMAMGFLLGAIFGATGSVLGPVLAHVGINYFNLRHIVDHDPPGTSRRDPTEPQLVSKQERR